MKDITDYFSSPTKARESPRQVDKVKCAQNKSDQNENTENKIEKNSTGFKVSKEEPPRRMKKKRRKPTDPEVKDVTELLSSNLSLVSPNTNGAKNVSNPSSVKKSKKAKRSSLESEKKDADQERHKSVNNQIKSSDNVTTKNLDRLQKFDLSKLEKTLETQSSGSPKEIHKTKKDNEEPDKTVNNIVEIKDTGTNSETPDKNSPRVNAFQFMMNSRNNVIGQNSNGKSVSEQDISIYCEKSKLATRKELFKNWANQKGAQKRKREEEEIEKCISNKLEKRAKRLRNLLQGDFEEKNKHVKKKQASVRNKKTVKGYFDSENSNDLTKNELELKDSTSTSIDISEIIEENAQDTVLKISSPPPKKHRENSQNNLLNFFGVLSNETKEERIEVFDETTKGPSKELIKIKMFTPESTKKRTSLLSLNRDRTRSVTDESSQESVKVKKHKKKKRKDMKEKCVVGLNDSLEDFCSPESKKPNTSVRKSRKDKLKKEDIEMQNKLKGDSFNEDKVDQSKTVANNIVNKEGGRSCLVEKVSKERPVDELEKKESKDEGKSNKPHCNDKPVDQSIQDSDIIKLRIKKGIKHCVIPDDLDSSNSLEGQNAEPIEETTPDLPAIKSTKKARPKVFIVNDSSVDPKNDLVSVVDKSLKTLEVTELKIKKKIKRVIDDSEDSNQEFAGIAPNAEKKQTVTTKVNKKVSKYSRRFRKKDQMKPENTVSRERVLRPKKNNVNYSELFKEGTQKIPVPNKKEKSSLKARNKRLNKDKSIEEVKLTSDSEYEEDTKKKASFKVAPVFLKATPKPKVDPQVVEARKKFLMSGVPDSLKKTIEKQRSIEEKEYDVFPSLSHIQQKCASRFWDLPKPTLKYATMTAFNPNEKYLHFLDLIVRNSPYEIKITTEVERINHFKTRLDKIKTDNPNYPVYKVFRHLYEKSGKNFIKEELRSKKSPRRRSKKGASKNCEPAEPDNTDSILKDCEMWSEKYKPRSSEEILGNPTAVVALKNWLRTWMNYSEEINARGKRKRTNSNSETEFESTDCDSRDSARLPGNTIILEGPCGSGKTSAIYAIANELGFNVLELNASSKRTGKRLIQELQEATQSHQVRKNENSAMSSFLNPEKVSKSKSAKLKEKEADSYEKSKQRDKKKMCILLIEDVDLVFDQDDGFLTSLFQLITTSKRPIILTTTDTSPGHVQKLLVQYEFITFMPLSLQCLGVWLQILCLIEGLLVDKDDLGNLLEYNKGDIRKTLLEVQFWCQSGGQLEKSRAFSLTSEASNNPVTCDLKAIDEELKFDLSEDNPGKDYFVHKHCIESFKVLRENIEYSVPQQLDLGTLWWNMPNILNVSSFAAERLQRQERKKSGDVNFEVTTEVTTENVTEKDRIKLNSVLGLYDAFTLTDSLFKSIKCQDSNEPVVKNWLTNVRDSLELTERTEDQGLCSDMVHDLTHTLVNGWVENYSSIDETRCGLNMAFPNIYERRWRVKQQSCENFLKQPISLWNTLDRSSIALDYLPTLRDIARYEDKRAASNTKRGNRFRHYLKNLNMDFKESTCKTACNSLNLTDDT